MSGSRRRTDTTVGIVGAGPAGLMASHLLAQRGIESVVVDNRTYLEIAQTVRAGILERDSVRMLVDSGVSDRVLHEGQEHAGIDLGFGGHVDIGSTSRTSLVRRSGCIRRRRSSSTWRRLGIETEGTFGSASAARRSSMSRATIRGSSSPTPTVSSRRCDATTWSAPTGRTASPVSRSRRGSAVTTSGSTRSRGSASSATRRRAGPSSSTTIPSAASR